MDDEKNQQIEPEEEIKPHYWKIILLSPFYLFVKGSFCIFLFLIGFIQNGYLLFSGKRNRYLLNTIIKVNSLDIQLGRIILFQSNHFFPERNTKEQLDENSEVTNNLSTNRLIVLERAGGLILFIQTRIIYCIFLFVNWIALLITKIFRISNESIRTFISNSLNEIYHTNLFLTGVQDETICWNSLKDPIAGIFFPILSHGFVFAYFLGYSHFVILRTGDFFDTFVFISRFYNPGTWIVVHGILIAVLLYSLFFLFLIPFYLGYPKKMTGKNIIQIWKELGVTLCYPLRDLAIIALFIVLFVFLYDGTLIPIFRLKKIVFYSSSFVSSLMMGIYWGYSEALVFRGYIITDLQRKMSNLWTIIISSSVFGVYHIVHLVFRQWDIVLGIMVNAFYFGVFFTIFRVQSKSFIGSMIVHISDYFFSSGAFPYNPTFITELRINMPYLSFFLIRPLFFVLIIIVIYLIYPRKEKKKNNLKDDKKVEVEQL